MYVERFLPFIGRCGPLIRYEIEKGAVRRYADAMGAQDAVFYDEQCAASSCWGRIPVPEGFYKTFDYGKVPGLEEVQPQAGLIHGGDTYESFKPIFVGDVVFARNKVVDAFEKLGRSGRMVFLIRECSLLDAHGDYYCRSLTTAIMKEELFTAGLQLVKEKSHLLSKRQPLQALLSPAALQVGDELPRLALPAIGRAMIFRYAGLVDDFNPLHTDDQAARKLGFEKIIAHGMIGVSLQLNMAREWFGTSCRLQKLSLRFGVPVYVDDVLESSGKVCALFYGQAEDTVECDLYLHNQHGQCVSTVHAVFVIPAHTGV